MTFGGNGLAFNVTGELVDGQRRLRSAAPGRFDEMMRKNPPVSKWVYVTPDMARTWLTKNDRNRKMDKRYARLIADDFSNGRWVPTHQGIAFDVSGTLLDGQHRLTAIVESDTAVWVLVTTGLPVEAQAEIDNQKKRSLAATLRMIDDVNTAGLERAVAITPYLMAPNGDIGGTYDSKQKRKECFFQHQEAIEWAMEALPYTKRVCRAPVYAVVVRAYYTQDIVKLRRFCEILITGEYNGEHAATTVIKLRNSLMQDNSKGSNGLTTSYRKTERALSAWINGERLQVLHEASSEQFPLPDEEIL